MKSGRISKSINTSGYLTGRIPALFFPSSQSQYCILPNLNFKGIFVADSNFHSFLQKKPGKVVERSACRIKAEDDFKKTGSGLKRQDIPANGCLDISGENWQKAVLATTIMQKNKIFHFSFIKK